MKVENGVPILSYYDDEKDGELLALSVYLKSIVHFEDLRHPNKFFFKFSEFRYFENPQDLVKNVF